MLCAGCLGEQPASLPLPPRISDASVGPNPYSVLSALVTFQVQDADSARVLYWTPGEAPLATPFYQVTDGRTIIATLGLRPGTPYYQLVEALAGDRGSLSDSVRITTPDLPPILRNVQLQVTGTPTGGYILICGVSLPGDTSAVVAF